MFLEHLLVNCKRNHYLYGKSWFLMLLKCNNNFRNNQIKNKKILHPLLLPPPPPSKKPWLWENHKKLCFTFLGINKPNCFHNYDCLKIDYFAGKNMKRCWLKIEIIFHFPFNLAFFKQVRLMLNVTISPQNDLSTTFFVPPTFQRVAINQALPL